MMFRVLNFLVVAGCLSTAAWAYSVKYETIYYVEQVKKLEKQTERQRDAINVLKAEWQHISKPQRIQPLAERHLDLQPLAGPQIVRAIDLPRKRERNDAIAEKIDQLMTGSVTPRPAQPAGPHAAAGRTPLPPPRPGATR
jgi:cell division protein FtsL